MSFITLTNHAKDRSLQRFGLSEETLLEFAEKSILHGYSTGDAPTEQIKTFLLHKKRGRQKIYVYQGYIFIFSSDLLLITTFRMPTKYLLSLPREKTYIG